MEKVIKFRAYDGFLFDTEEEALAHEARLTDWVDRPWEHKEIIEKSLTNEELLCLKQP